MKGGTRRERRRWLFGSAIFDEPSWTLHVGGRPVAVEGRPLALLHELLLHAGETVSKDELMERVWPGVFVAEASLTTAMRKLRHALGDASRDSRIIETVSGLGYRLTIPVEVEALPETPPGEPLRASGFRVPDSPSMISQETRKIGAQNGVRAKPALLGAGALGFLALALVATTSPIAPTTPESAASGWSAEHRDTIAALRRLDTQAVLEMSKRGWDPNRPLDKFGNVPLGVTVEICEWDRDHDPQKLLLMVRMLYDAGARVEVRNIYGDTPYSIAKAERFCGPDHPVTKMMARECFSGENPLGDRCLATYELARRDQARRRP